MADLTLPLTLPRRPGRQTTSTFNLPSSDSSDTEDDAPLPFPAALPRTDFLATDFQPAAYLSALPHRHQTLEDLRSDLRERTATISTELLELVNSNYTAFLSLGSELRGGDEKVEDVKVSLLGFRRAVEEVKEKVSERRKDAESLTNELRDIRSDIEQGRAMLEVSERLSTLEETLALDSLPQKKKAAEWDSDSDDDEELGEEAVDGLIGSPPSKLLASARDCSQVAALIGKLDESHAFVAKLKARLAKCRNTLLLDLNNALKEARAAGAKGQGRVLGYLGVYRVLDAQGDAIKALRGR
ncbi:conserved oligomeric golgi complex subunit 2 [Trichoderma arundinaceum]|uniref:Conserved oligomeric Golgi complex subunit 2 n=1 Tax=Trichoderma arundinaceum TaxID=490622 RepID=A0A395NU42_TRIAR|nr:conserved oligomeric golgi complex subunit 2 [Trichoderma arundinaceum]